MKYLLLMWSGIVSAGIIDVVPTNTTRGGNSIFINDAFQWNELGTIDGGDLWSEAGFENPLLGIEGFTSFLWRGAENGDKADLRLSDGELRACGQNPIVTLQQNLGGDQHAMSAWFNMGDPTCEEELERELAKANRLTSESGGEIPEPNTLTFVLFAILLIFVLKLR